MWPSNVSYIGAGIGIGTPPIVGFSAPLEAAYLLGLDIGVWLALCAHLLFLWMAIFCTPKEMFNYRLTVSNTTGWSLLQLLVLGVFIRPVPLFPVPAAKITGLLSNFGTFGPQFGWQLATVCMANYVLAAVCCFLTICVFLLEPKWPLIEAISRPVGVAIGIGTHLATTFCVALLMAFVFPPPVDLNAELLRANPQLQFLLSSDANSLPLLFGYGPSSNGHLALVIGSLLLGILLLVGLLYAMLVHQIVANLHKNTWDETVRQRRNVVIMLTARVLSPTLFGFVPAILLCLNVHFGLAWPFSWNCALSSVAITHGFQQSIATIVAYRPYRRAIYGRLKCLHGFLGPAKSRQTCKPPTLVAVHTKRAVQRFYLA